MSTNQEKSVYTPGIEVSGTPMEASQQAPSYYAQQPVATPMMTIDPRNAKNIPVRTDGERKWSHSLFGCFEACGTCCCAALCPAVVYARNKARLDYLSAQGRPIPQSPSGYNEDCAVYCGLCLLTGFGWCLQMPLRRSVRQRYNIDGGACGDCLASWLCHSCELTQSHREIELEEQTLKAMQQY